MFWNRSMPKDGPHLELKEKGKKSKTHIIQDFSRYDELSDSSKAKIKRHIIVKVFFYYKHIKLTQYQYKTSPPPLVDPHTAEIINVYTLGFLS